MILVTPRLDIIEDRNEVRLSLDLRWVKLLEYLDIKFQIFGYQDICKVDNEYFFNDIQGVLLTGGNNIPGLNVRSDSVDYIRNDIEKKIFEYALKNQLPVLGVCRGMQFINHYFGGQLKKIAGHAGTQHLISFNQCKYRDRIVNSYHDFGISQDGLADALKILGKDIDGNIEFFRHNRLSVWGIMWHPEREPQFVGEDLNLLREIFF
jgi:N5-(cytidine 5'-diphosphoramidyl)-L-glutamine hydrolase